MVQNYISPGEKQIKLVLPGLRNIVLIVNVLYHSLFLIKLVFSNMVTIPLFITYKLHYSITHLQAFFSSSFKNSKIGLSSLLELQYFSNPRDNFFMLTDNMETLVTFPINIQMLVSNVICFLYLLNVHQNVCQVKLLQTVNCKDTNTSFAVFLQVFLLLTYQNS